MKKKKKDVVEGEIIKVKIILVGESTVGKTSIITQYLHKKFSPEEIKTTTSCDKWEKEIKLENILF